MFFSFYNNSQSRLRADKALACIFLFIGISAAASNPAPGISSVAPNAGSTNGGTSVTINGANFLTGATVSFGSQAASNVVVVSSSTITATTPANPAGTVNVTVTNSDAQSATLNNGYTYNLPPSATSISPAGGPTGGGTSVTITGTNFVSGATVSFGGVAASNVVVTSGTTITATTPANPAGAVNVVITNPDGQTATLAALITPLPNPGFEQGLANWVFSGTGSASAINDPVQAHNGNGLAQLVSPAGDRPILNAIVAPGNSQYLPVKPGDVINFGSWINRIAGDGTARVTIQVSDSAKANAVYISTLGATLNSWTFFQKSYTIPAGKAFVRFYAEIYGNTVQATANFDDTFLQQQVAGGGFTYANAPSISSLNPNAGSTNGGTSVTINGANFLSGATVRFGGLAATNVTVTNSTTITATTPASPAGTVNVTVTNPDARTATLTNGYTYNLPPTVSSITPNQGTSSGGTSVTIAGTNFISGATATLGGSALTNVAASNTAITGLTSSHAVGVVNVVVKNPDNQSATLSAGFTYIAPPPTVTSISPKFGPASGGTLVTINGSKFQTGATVTMGGATASNVTFVSSTQLTAVSPTHTAGAIDLVVTNPDTQSASLPTLLHNEGFESGTAYWAFSGTGSAKILSDVTQAHNGTFYAELSSASSQHPMLFAADASGIPLYFAVTAGDVLTFGGWTYRVSGNGKARWMLEATDANHSNPSYIEPVPFNSWDQIWRKQTGTYTVPAGKAFVRLFCEISNTSSAVARFEDAFLSKQGASVPFSFVSPPIAFSVSPNWGAPAGGTTRTVYGTGFTTGAAVTVGGLSGTNVSVPTNNAVVFFVPPNSVGPVDVTVANADGQSTTLAGAYSYANPPASPAGLTNLRHIIFTLQENRSFDNYFGVMNQYRASRGLNDNAVDGLPLNIALPAANGNMVLPFHFRTVCEENTQPSWNASHFDVDGGKMDLFLQTGNWFTKPSTIDPNGTRAMGYYDWTDLPYYYDLAFQFAMSDRYFSSVLDATPPNRMYSFAASSLGNSNNPQVTGGLPNLTIFDLLDQANVTWRYYYQYTAPSWLPFFSVYYRDIANVAPYSNFYNDVKNESTFPQVVFIEEGGFDEHPQPNPGNTTPTQNIQLGATRTGTFINALMKSASWPSSVFILSYDEGGGLHDHVPPATMPPPDGFPPLVPNIAAGGQPGIYNQSGFRVPMVVISPWVKRNFVSHVSRDHTSILKLIETRFSLPPLSSRDASPSTDDMQEFFNFTVTPSFTIPTVATQPTNGTCDLNLETAP